MILRLVLAELRHRPGRAAFLLTGYALGVAVMVVLLAVGEAMLEQARDRTLLGGGDLVVVPAGISAEMLRAGGATSLFLGVDQARFLQRLVLESPRARERYGVEAASPILDGKLVRLGVGGREIQALASAEIPSRARAAGAAPRLLAGSWTDSEADRRWVAPTPHELYSEIDGFHLPYGTAVGDSTWAEWHYFNVVLDEERWLYLTLMLGGRVGAPGGWGGRLLLTVREADGTHRSRTLDVSDDRVRFRSGSPELRLGDDARVELRGGVYRVEAALEEARVALDLTPQPGRWFPPSEIGGAERVSGYVVPALHARARGTVCLPRCEAVTDAPAYHDHNWGVWREVSWEWGTASSERLSLLYGVVRGEEGREPKPFAYLADDQGVRGLFRPERIDFPATRRMGLPNATLEVPERIEFRDARRGLRVSIDVHAVHATDLRRERRRFFLQMRGVATVEQPGWPIERLPGFFETYVDPLPDPP